MKNRVDDTIYHAGVRAANGSTRRGFLGRIGLAGAALGTGGLVAIPQDAHALCSGSTVTCNEYYGFNGCASNLCEDGSWCVPPGHCDNIYGGGTRWRDCCSNSCGCRSVAGKPSCCNGCIYGNSCSSANGWKVVCRYHMAC